MSLRAAVSHSGSDLNERQWPQPNSNPDTNAQAKCLKRNSILRVNKIEINKKAHEWILIAVQPSFEDHCAGNEDPETDGANPQTKKGHQSKPVCFYGDGPWRECKHLLVSYREFISPTNRTPPQKQQLSKATTEHEGRLHYGRRWREVTAEDHDQVSHSLFPWRAVQVPSNAFRMLQHSL